MRTDSNVSATRDHRPTGRRGLEAVKAPTPGVARALHDTQTTTTPGPVQRMVRKRGVAEMLGSSVKRVEKLVKEDPAFPRPRQLGASQLWIVVEVEQYIMSLPVRPPQPKPAQFRRHAATSKRQRREVAHAGA